MRTAQPASALHFCSVSLDFLLIVFRFISYHTSLFASISSLFRLNNLFSHIYTISASIICLIHLCFIHFYNLIHSFFTFFLLYFIHLYSFYFISFIFFPIRYKHQWPKRPKKPPFFFFSSFSEEAGVSLAEVVSSTPITVGLTPSPP